MDSFQIYVNPHCHDCDALIEAMQATVRRNGYPDAALLNVLEHVDAAVALRITRVPALVYADKLIAQGVVSEEQLEKRLKHSLATIELSND